MASAANWILSPDFQQETPLHCAVVNNHLEITKLFLIYLKPKASAGFDEQVSDIFVEIMIIAIASGFDEIVELLISAQIGINQQNSRGETALYVAAKLGRDDYVKLLLHNPSTRQVIDSAEHAYRWSPLFVACVKGHSAIAELLFSCRSGLYESGYWRMVNKRTRCLQRTPGASHTSSLMDEDDSG